MPKTDPYAATAIKAPEADPYAATAIKAPEADPYAATAVSAAAPESASDAPLSPTLFQRMKTNFNANTQGAEHKPGESNLARLKVDVQNVGAGGGDVARSAAHPIRTIGQMIQQNFGPPEDTGVLGVAEVMGGPLVRNAISIGKGLRQNPARTIGQLGTGMILDGIVRGGVGGVKKGLSNPLKRYAPSTVKIAGEDIPQMVGEVSPTSKPGRLQTMLKRTGVKGPQFEKFEQAQMSKVKNAIRNVAQQTSEMTGPMPEEPGTAMKSASDATFDRARPMYAALDEDLITVDGDFHAASTITKKAISRAKSLGYDFKSQAESHYDEEPMGTGKKISEGGQPLQSFMKVRSELGKMRRGSSDAAFRYAASEEIKQMTAAMDKALSNTGLKETWKQADRLWSKGYALNEIADAIKDSTQGIEKASQVKGNDPVQSVLKGRKLEETLKDLADDGTLQKGLSPEEISNLRQSANVLTRAQTTSIGKGAGEGTSLWKGIGQATAGVAGPATGAGIGFMLDGISGAEKGAAIGLIAQQIGTKALVRIMTMTEGVEALKSLDKAQTKVALNTAVKAIVATAGTVKEKPKKKVAAALSQ